MAAGRVPDLSLILACYHEEQILESSVEAILKVLRASRLRWEIIFVEDASRDRTRNLIKGLLARHRTLPLRAIFHDRNMGRGRSVADGFRAARGRVVGFIDVDLEVPAHYVPACWQAIADGADIALGKRVFKFSMRGIVRYAMSIGYASVVRRLLPVPGVTDTESGYKFFRREVALALVDEVQDPGWFWDTEIMFRASRGGLVITETPCLFVRNLAKQSTVRPLRDSLHYLRTVLAFRRRVAREDGGGPESARYWKEQGTAFARHYDRGQATGPMRFVRGFLEQRARILDGWLAVRPGMRVLDVGCGHGLHLVSMGRRGARVTGVDISPGMIAQARAALIAAGIRSFRLVCAPLEAARLPAGASDLVLAVGLLDYLPAWQTAWRLLATRARLGGSVIVSVPKRPSPFFFFRTRPGIWFRRVLFNLPPIMVTATRAELDAAALGAGVQLTEVVACQGTMWLARGRRVR